MDFYIFIHLNKSVSSAFEKLVIMNMCYLLGSDISLLIWTQMIEDMPLGHLEV